MQMACGGGEGRRLGSNDRAARRTRWRGCEPMAAVRKSRRGIAPHVGDRGNRRRPRSHGRVDTQRRLASTDMNTVFSHQYRPSRQRRRFAAETKSGWLELGDAAILYFGVTLL